MYFLFIGVQTKEELSDAKEYKRLFITVYSRQNSLKDGTALQAEFLHGHTDRVMAIYYHNGLLATGNRQLLLRFCLPAPFFASFIYRVTACILTNLK